MDYKHMVQGKYHLDMFPDLLCRCNHCCGLLQHQKSTGTAAEQLYYRHSFSGCHGDKSVGMYWVLSFGYIAQMVNIV